MLGQIPLIGALSCVWEEVDIFGLFEGLNSVGCGGFDGLDGACGELSDISLEVRKGTLDRVELGLKDGR
jgi:hypothetical protein